MRVIPAVVAGLLIVSGGSAASQQAQSSLQGRIVDESGAVLPGVVVVVTHQQTGMFRQVVSNEDGSYYVTGIVPGVYRVTAELQGFKKYERPDVVLEIGRTTTLDIRLEVGLLEETVTVTGEAPLVDVTSKQIGGHITSGELVELPSHGRNWLYMVGLLPGIQVQASTASFGCESFIIAGQSNRSGNLLLDGAGNNDDYLGGSCASQTRTAIDAVQEYQVLTHQYDAEFGRTAGAVVNAITKQGTNAFHGSAFGTFTNSKITARDFFVAQQNLTKPKTNKKESGGTLGGPIVRDKAHFFASLERIVYGEGRSNTFAARPELDFSNVQRYSIWNYLIRFDHQINASNTWAFRYMREDSPLYDRISGRRSFAARDQEYDVDYTIVGNWNAVFGNNRFNTIRVGHVYEKNGFAPAEFHNGTHLWELPPSLQMLTFLDQKANGGGYRINGSYEVSETFTWFIPNRAGGDHDLKFGAQYIFSQFEFPDEGNMNGTFFFATDLPFDPRNPRTYPERLSIRVPAPADPYQQANIFSVFAQDKWQRDTVTVNLGVRYDLEIHPLDNLFNPFFKPGEYAVDKNNVAPRVGFTWNPDRNGTAVFRGGYGIFYDKIYFQTTFPFIQSGVFSPSFTAFFPADRADPGPSRGQMPTDPMLVGGPVVNRTLLNALYPPGTLARNTGIVYLDNPDRVIPHSHQVTFGYQRQLWRDVAASIDYVHSWDRDLLVAYNLNPALRIDTTRTGRLVYTDLFDLAGRLGVAPFRNPVYTRRNDGKNQFDGLNMMVEKRYSNRWSARVSYGVGYARGNAEADQTYINQFQFLDDPRLDLAEGRLNNDRRHNVVLSGRLEIPGTGGLVVTGTYRYMTGAPLTIHNTAVDADRNGQLFDPLPAGRYCGQGLNAICVESKGGRNGATGPSFQQCDLRVGYRFRLGTGRTLDVYGEVFNLFNTANFSNPTGDMRSTDFLRLTSLRGGSGFPRQGQFGMRFVF